MISININSFEVILSSTFSNYYFLNMYSLFAINGTSLILPYSDSSKNLGLTIADLTSFNGGLIIFDYDNP